MSQELIKLKRYIEKLFTKKEKFSLVKLITSFEEVLIRYMPLSHVFKLLKPYYVEVDGILNRYKLKKKSIKNPMQRRHLREQAAKRFFGVLEKLGGMIPKWLSALPEGMKANEFARWKENTSKGEFKFLVAIVSSGAQLQSLRNGLCNVANAVADIADNKKFKRLVEKNIGEEKPIADSDVAIGAPTIKYGPKYN